MPRTILVAGASGALGRRVIPRLAAAGWRVRALGRDARRLAALGADVAEPVVAPRLGPRAFAEAVDGVEAVFSCLGANVLPDPRLGWRGFRAVDRDLNLGLLAAAARAGVKKMTYVSVHHVDGMRRLGYVRAHEEVVDALRASGLSWSVVRPTGFFSAIGSFVDMARRGRMPRFGRPGARTNPIHDDDLADVCAAAVDGDAAEVAVGGPEVLTRGAMAELAFAAIGAPPRYLPLPSWLMRSAALALRPLLPRVADLLAFFDTVGGIDLVAPAHGTRRLGDYFLLLSHRERLTLPMGKPHDGQG
jgi:uncharacterized protein YbjT (DUF2867 family)